jgi:hypothetical protein
VVGAGGVRRKLLVVEGRAPPGWGEESLEGRRVVEPSCHRGGEASRVAMPSSRATAAWRKMVGVNDRGRRGLLCRKDDRRGDPPDRAEEGAGSAGGRPTLGGDLS